jgi:hypothetical protein
MRALCGLALSSITACQQMDDYQNGVHRAKHVVAVCNAFVVTL